MFSEYSLQFTQYINGLQGTPKVLVLLGLYIGVPLLMVVLYMLNKKIEIKQFKRQMREQIERETRELGNETNCGKWI